MLKRLFPAILAVLLMTGAFAAPAMADCPNPNGLFKMRDNVLAMVNAHRAANGKTALTKKWPLMQAAQKHACYMAEKQILSHTGRGGSDVVQRVQAEGYVWGYVAENVAEGQKHGAAVFQAWKASPPHNKNMLDAGARELGMGWAKDATGRNYWVMVLGAPR